MNKLTNKQKGYIILFKWAGYKGWVIFGTVKKDIVPIKPVSPYVFSTYKEAEEYALSLLSNETYHIVNYLIAYIGESATEKRLSGLVKKFKKKFMRGKELSISDVNLYNSITRRLNNDKISEKKEKRLQPESEI